MKLMDIDEDTFIDKNLRMEGVVTEGQTPEVPELPELPDSDTPLQPAERKRFLPFDLVALPRIKLSSRHVSVCVGVLCVVLLAGNIGQLIYHKSHRLQRRYDALTAQRDQLQLRLSELTREKQQLLQSYKTLNRSSTQLQSSYDSLRKDREGFETLQREKEHLQTSYTDLATGCLLITKQFTSQKLKTVVQSSSLPCQIGWRKFGDSCYMLSTVDKNWEESREACSRVGADLAVINSRDEQEFINGLLTSEQNVWIGLTDSHKEGNWTWVDGTPASTTFWESGQPNSYKGFNQDCVETVQRSSGVGEWNDEQCSSEQKCVCEQ